MVPFAERQGMPAKFCGNAQDQPQSVLFLAAILDRLSNVCMHSRSPTVWLAIYLLSVAQHCQRRVQFTTVSVMTLIQCCS